MRYGIKISVLVLGASLAGCVEESPDEVESAELEALDVARTEIARVTAGDGELTFYALAPGGVAIRESRTAGAFVSSDGSALATFLAATPPGTPVPRALLEDESSLELQNQARLRGLVDRLADPAAATDGDLAGPPQVQAASAYCTGTTSQSWLTDICTLTNWEVDFCHNGTWNSVTDAVGSSNKKHSSRSVTIGCGANGHVRHYYKFGGVWYKPLDEITPSNTAVQWTVSGGWALERKIIHSRTTNSSFVRASSHFNHG